MEALGVAASVANILDLSAKIATLCIQYSKEVAGARADIKRIHSQVGQLDITLQAAKRLIEGSKDQSLLASKALTSSFDECDVYLRQLEKRLSPTPARTAMRRFGLRALKWPCNSKEVDQVLSHLDRHEKTISFGLQLDQTTMLINIQDGVKQLGLQKTQDTSVPRKSHQMVPFPPDQDFVHRPAIWEWMKNQYVEPARRMALVGMGGFGKSQLAIHFAHQVHTDSPDTNIFWVHTNNRVTFEESYRALADVLALPRRHEPEVDVLALVRDCLQTDDIGPWLMVVDNADDVGVLFSDKGKDNVSQNPLASYLPKSANGRILVTSRSLDVAERLVGSSKAILRISVMGTEQAHELLRKKLNIEEDASAEMDLIRTLDCIPLAIGQAAAYINRRSPRVSVRSYVDEFLKSEKRKDSLLRSDKGDLGRYDGVSNSVVVTWQVTFEQIRRDHPYAANLLSLMSQFQAQNIPEYMLYSYDDDAESSSDEESENGETEDNLDAENISDDDSENNYFEDDLDVLRGYSLVTLTATGLCEMHSLVQFCTRSWISEFGDPIRWSRLFIRLAADHFPSGQFEKWGDCQSLLPHVERVLARKPTERCVLLDWAELLTNVSSYMVMTGEYSPAEVMAREAIRVRKDILGPDDPSTLTSMGVLAMTFLDQGRWDESEKLEREVIETRKIKLGASHPHTLISMANLATTLWKQDRHDEAEKLEVEVVETCKMKHGPDHPNTLTSMGNLSVTYGEQGRWEEAEKLQAEVLELRKAKFGADHPDTLTSMANLASRYKSRGRWEEAEKLEVEVLETRKEKLGDNHPDTLVSIANLAETYENLGRQEEAEKLKIEVLEARKKKLGDNHPDTLVSISNLALGYEEQGRQEEAKKLLVEALEARKTKLGIGHHSMSGIMSCLVSIYKDQGRWEEAEKLEVEVLEDCKTKLGADHPDTLTAMHNLAFTWHDSGRKDDALVLIKDCYDLKEKKLGPNHPKTTSSLKALKSWQEAGRTTDEDSKI